MYIPHTNPEREQMLEAVGKKEIEDLFTDIPIQYRFPELDLPAALSEQEVLEEIEFLASANNTCKEFSSFLGGGAYHHYVPAAVDMILRRGDFFTAYTPYQPEISQGTLQAVFEYQSLISNLTGMDVSNASHYDGATASAEACLSAFHHFRGKRKRFILSGSVNPQYRETIHTYLGALQDGELLTSPGDPGLDDFEWIGEHLNEGTAIVMMQYPDYFGRLCDYSRLSEQIHQKGSLLAVSTYPIALGLCKPPSEFGADFVVGDGQPLGIPLNFGGPYLGFFATKKELIRKISGRLVGETEDVDGKRGYVLTLTAREQHIRRGKATSNICTNQGLMTLASTVYLSLLGKDGLKKVAELCYQKAHYTASEINSLEGFSINLTRPFFNEFVVKTPKPVSEINGYLLDNGYFGGIDLSVSFPDLANNLLVAVTEMNSKEEIDQFVNLLAESNNG
jgi:glycine dehydrogenase subunit 1